MMKILRAGICGTLILLAMWLPVLAQETSTNNDEFLRTGLTLGVAAIGLGVGASIALGFANDAMDTPLSDTLLLAIPVAAVGAASGALAGHWMADVVLRTRPAPLFSILEGAGLGLVSGAAVGAITFTVNFAIAEPILEEPEGYWGRYDYLPTLGLSLAAGGLWGGLAGLAGGAVVLPIISLTMHF